MNRVVGGVNVAFKRKISVAGNEVANVTLLEYEVNPTVDPKLFDRPAK